AAWFGSGCGDPSVRASSWSGRLGGSVHRSRRKASGCVQCQGLRLYSCKKDRVGGSSARPLR
ncbi:unnamed protein product, partial [Musa textilis]